MLVWLSSISSYEVYFKLQIRIYSLLKFDVEFVVDAGQCSIKSLVAKSKVSLTNRVSHSDHDKKRSTSPDTRDNVKKLKRSCENDSKIDITTPGINLISEHDDLPEKIKIKYKNNISATTVGSSKKDVCSNLNCKTANSTFHEISKKSHKEIKLTLDNSSPESENDLQKVSCTTSTSSSNKQQEKNYTCKMSTIGIKSTDSYDESTSKTGICHANEMPKKFHKDNIATLDRFLSQKDEDLPSNTNTQKTMSHKEESQIPSRIISDPCKKVSQVYENNTEFNLVDVVPEEMCDSQKIDIIMKNVEELKTEVLSLKSMRISLAKPKQDDTIILEDIPVCKDVLKKIMSSRSIIDIEKAGFKYYKETEEIACEVCEEHDTLSKGGVYDYSKDEPVHFSTEVTLSERFKNLKYSLKRHVTNSQTHEENVFKAQEKLAKGNKIKTKNYKAGLNIGRTCMKLYIKGRPYTDFETDMINLKIAGAPNVGELHHSRKFPAEFRPFVSTVIKGRVEKYITTNLLQTGHLPPIALSADKATYKHRSRQFLSIVTIVPDGENFLEVISCGQPVVKEGSDAVGLAKNIKEGLDAYAITGSQIESAVFDGVYFHCNVPEMLNHYYELDQDSVMYSWDALHQCGLIDTHMCKKDQFAWLQKDTETCQQVFSTYNWGANYEKLYDATALWKLNLSNLTNFSTTRFANSRRKVYINIRNEFPAICTCLENDIAAGIKDRSSYGASNTKLREKETKARELKGKILNARFLLTLSGLADAYNQFGAVVNVAQMIHLLPHERLELYLSKVQVFDDMEKCLNDHSQCNIYSENKKIKCMWPLNHNDKRDLIKKGEIRKIPIIDKTTTKAAGLNVETRCSQSLEHRNKDISAEKISDKELILLVKELYRGLKNEVYDPKDVEIINLTKVILDLPSLGKKLHSVGGGYIKVSRQEFPTYLHAIKNIPVRSLNNINEEVLKSEYKEFLRRLEVLTKKYKFEELNDLDPKKLIEAFFKTSDRLYVDIEMIMQSIAVSSVKQSCESILESLVSQYENHFDSRRSLNEENANEEFVISVNGPNLTHCDAVVNEAMDMYWKSKNSPWHFYRTSTLERLKKYDGDSEVFHKLLNTHSRLAFME